MGSIMVNSHPGIFICEGTDLGNVHIPLSFYVSGYDWGSDKKSVMFFLFLTSTENKTFEQKDK